MRGNNREINDKDRKSWINTINGEDSEREIRGRRYSIKFRVM